MRIRQSTQFLGFVALCYFGFFTYTNRDQIFAWHEGTSILVKTERYGEEFCVGFNVTRAQEAFFDCGLEPVSLAVHTTPNYLNYVFEQVETWGGPISVALFVDWQSQKAVEFLYNIINCKKVSLHVVFRLPPFSNECPSFELTVEPRYMRITTEYTKRFMDNLIPPFAIYPINTMRNVARKGAGSHFHLVSDVEMIFSEDFYRQVTKLADETIGRDSRNVLVFRRFELDVKVKEIPRTIQKLKAVTDKKGVFEFHHQTFPAGHTIPELQHWFNVSSLSIAPFAWKIPYKSSEWEPQLIMHSSAPFNEENMPTRFRDQQALCYELCRANYTFFLASHLFNVHRGVKDKSSPLELAVTEHQQRLRDKLKKDYLRRINGLYRPSKRCGDFVM